MSTTADQSISVGASADFQEPTAEERRPVRILINRDYALLWTGQFISLTGDAILATTLVLWIATGIAAGRSWAPAAVGFLVFARAVPQAAIGPVAGVFADRWPNKPTLLAMDGIRAGVLGVAILMSAPLFGASLVRGNGLLPVIYVMVVLMTIASSLFSPARLSVIADVVPEGDRPRASGLAQSSAAVAAIVGPAVAAPVVVAFSPGWGLGLDAVTFLASFACIAVARVSALGVERRPPEPDGLRSQFMAGVRTLTGSPTLRALLVAGVMFVLGEAAVNTLSVFFLRLNLHAPTRDFGLLASAEGAGAVVGAVAAGWAGRKLGPGRLLWGSAVFFGVFTLALSRLSSLTVALLVVGLLGACFASMEVAETPLLLAATPRHLIGRVSALLLPSYSVADTISALGAGWLASTTLHGFHATALGLQLGPIDTIYAAAGGMALLAAFYARANLPNNPST